MSIYFCVAALRSLWIPAVSIMFTHDRGDDGKRRKAEAKTYKALDMPSSALVTGILEGY